MIRYLMIGLPLGVALAVGGIAALVFAFGPFGGDSGPAGDTPVVDRTDTAETTAAGDPAARAEGPLAPEVEGIARWVNSEPLSIKGLAGQVVLVDFWTYTCINCIRTFPFLKLWNARYSDDGLVILGVHTPEFDFEKDYDNVVQATQENGIVWPVAQDNDYVTWDNFSNRFWPAKYLIDKDGVIRYTHFGEGAYGETETKIRELLEEAGADLSDDPVILPQDQEIDPTFLQTRNAEVTRELYAGQERGFLDAVYGRGGYVGQQAYYDAMDEVVDFTAPQQLSPHLIYFNGPWFLDAERARHARATGHYDDYLALVYSAKSVNAVLTSDSGEGYKVRVTMDGEYLTGENKGADVMIGDDGESFILVDAPRLYEVVDNPAYVRRSELRLSSTSDDFGLFAFTFGVYREGP